MRKGNYANGDGHYEEKVLTSPVPAAPKYTHIMHTPFSQLSFGPVWGVCLFWLSLKHALTIAAILPVPQPFLLTILARLKPTGQVLRQEDRMPSATMTNNIGLSNF